MRADRLVAALLLMQSRSRVTAAELAAELEVSVATARRDLEALSAAGIPVYPQPGRGGGWSLVGGARTDLTGLSATEAQALFLLVGPAAAVSGEAKAALRKLVRALPQTFRADAEAAASATHDRPDPVGRAGPAPARAGRPAAGRRGPPAQVPPDLRPAVPGSARERLVDPWGLVDKDDIWYLIAGTERGQRTFRVDRILEAEPTASPPSRPDDFALAAAWDRSSARSSSGAPAPGRPCSSRPRFVPVLRDHFGRHCQDDGQADDGRARVRVAAPTPLDIARHLAGWGAMIEVIEPGVVERLARIGAEILERYPTA